MVCDCLQQGNKELRMFSNDGRSLLKRIAVLALCAFISIAYMPGVAYALEGEEADGNGSQVEASIDGENADADAAVNEEAGEEAGSGEEDIVEEKSEEVSEEEPAVEEEPVDKEDSVNEEPVEEEDPADMEEETGSEEVQADSADSTEYPQLQMDTDYSIDCSDGEVWYTFTPDEDGYYVIYSYNSEGDPKVYVYESDPEESTDSFSDDDGGDGNNFRLKEKFTAGNTYYVKFSTFSGDATYTARVEKVAMTTVTFNTNKPTDIAWFEYEDPDTYEISKVSSISKEFEVGSSISDGYISPYYDDIGLGFIGYSTDKDAMTGSTDIRVTENMQLYAVWGEYVTVTYDAGEDKGGYFMVWDEEAEEDVKSAVQEYSAVTGRHFESYEPENDNRLMKFDGWYDDNGTQWTYDSIITESLTVHARWKETKVVDLTEGSAVTVTQADEDTYYRFTAPEAGNYQVAFSVGDREYYEIRRYDEDLDYIGGSYGHESLKLLILDQEKGAVSYFRFVDDYEDSSYTGTATVNKVNVTDVTFHANNDAAHYYDQEAGSYTADTYVQRYAQGDVIGNSVNNPYYEDDTIDFLGWSTSPNASASDSQIVVGTEPLDVYGVWASKTKVVFHANNDGAYMMRQYDDDDNVEYIESLTRYYRVNSKIEKWDENPDTKDGARIKFLGWATKPDAAEPESSITVTESEQLDLYAVWKPYYEVTYNANGGYVYEDEETSMVMVDEGASFGVLNVKNEDPFKVFDGWYDAATGGKKYTEADSVTGDLTVYAHWKEAETSAIETDVLAVASNSGKNVYTFTPSEDGTYAFNSAEPYEHYPKAVLYNSAKEILAEDTNGGYDGNFFLVCDLKGGQTYTLVVDHQSWGSTDYKIIVRKVDLSTVTYVANHDGAFMTDDSGNKVSTMTKSYTRMREISEDVIAESDSDALRFRGWSTDKEAKAPEEVIYTGKDMTLYGVWEERALITFHSNNSEIYYDEEDGDYDYDYRSSVRIGYVIDSEYEHDFYNTGNYTFLGWSTQEGATEAEESITVTAELTDLYAVWEKKAGPGPQGDVIPLVLNEVKTVNYNGAPVRFSFVPEEDGIYVFESSNNSNDPYGTLYDENLNRLSTNDDGGTDVNFRIVRELKKGSTYYLDAREYTVGRTGSHFDVKVIKPVTYTVTFHANDSTASFYDDGDGSNLGKEHTEVYLEGDVIRNSTDLDPAYLVNNDANKMFCCWATTADASSGTDEERIVVNGNLDVYAVWKPLVKVRFNTNSDKITIWDNPSESYVKATTRSYAEGASIGIYDYDSFNNIPEGKFFAGWATTADATKPTYNITAANGLELYAVWADKIVVTLDANGGYFDQGDFIRARVFMPESDYFGSHPDWEDDSKVFIGWATTPDATVPDVYEDEPVYAGLDTVYAVWGDAVTVTYDANGGYLDLYDEPVTSYTDQFEKGSKFTSLNAYYPDQSYKFSGWYTEKEGGDPVYNTELTQDMTVYAHWDKTHAVTLHANGGYFETAGNVERTRYFTDNESFYAGEYNTPEIDDANTIFAGWATTANAETPDIIPGHTNMKGITDVYAVWETSITITLHANGGYFDETSSNTVSFKARKGSRLGALDDYEAQSNDAYKRDDGKRSLSATGAALASDYVLNSNTDLYVIWTDLVDVTYDAGDGYVYGEGGKTYTVKVAKNEPWSANEFTAVNNSADIGFLGWSVTPDGKSVVKTITPVSAQTLYAAYADGPKVTLLSTAGGTVRGTVNGEAVNQANNTFIWAKGLKLKDLDIYGSARDGYIFLGFSTSTEETEIVPADYEPKGAVTLYAIFAEGYDVELDAYPGHFPGSGSSNLTVQVRKGEAVGAVETPVYTDYVLAGWRDDDTGVTIAPEDLTSYVPSGDTWLSAIWEDVAVHVTGVKLNKTAANIQVGKTLQLAAAVTPGDATNKDVVWSSDTSVATVDATGRVTGKKAGTAVITAKTVDGEITAKCTVKVFGKTKVISGHTYTLVSLANKTVSFTKAKNTATVTVPATVKINGVSFKVTQVGSKAFNGASIKTVTIGSNVTTINAKAFTGSKITKVTIGKNVNKLKASAFYGNSKGKSLTITMKTPKLTKASTFKNFMKGTKAKSVTIKVSVGTAAKNKKTRTTYKKIFTKSNVGVKVTIK